MPSSILKNEPIMAFKPDEVSAKQPSMLQDESGQTWTPLYRQTCSFPPEIFREVMLNLIKNPNINSNHLFRADIALDTTFANYLTSPSDIPCRITQFRDFDLGIIMVRTLIPRNPNVDNPLDQTCLIYEKRLNSGETKSLVIYLPHISEPSESPFYHPAVHGIAFLHVFHPSNQEGTISIEYSFFDSSPRNPKLERTALHLLSAVYKHGQGKAAGYVKRVHHDIILPQAAVQNTYARLKAKYAKPMIDAWVETTDPGKHVFEDLGIAAFLIELWKEMYEGKEFPGFVDIGCGNGLLVHVLLEEGYAGWGFDARARKSWSIYGMKAIENLFELVLIPFIIRSRVVEDGGINNTQLISNDPTFEEPSQNITSPSPSITKTQSSEDNKGDEINHSSKHSTNGTQKQNAPKAKTHDGSFPPGTFIISNHADELTPWTPILATLSSSPFMMIPCCSHSLNGARFRAPPSKVAGASNSAFASLVAWVSNIARECGWNIEVEMLRIPSTRNTALIGRSRLAGVEHSPDVVTEMINLVKRHGGADGWEENALKLVKASTRSH